MREAEFVTDPTFYALAVPVVLLVGVSKGGFGGGAGMIAVPALSFAVPLPQAAAILLPILCAMDLVAVHAFRGRHSVPHTRLLLPGAVLGIAAGAFAFGSFDERWLRVAVGAIAVIFTLHWLWSRRNRSASISRAEPESNKASLSAGTFWGLLAGFTSTLAHAGGPPVSIFLLPQRLPPALYVGTTVIVFTVINYVKLIPYAWLGQLRSDNLVTSLILLPLAPLGVRLGRWLHDRIDETLFYRLVYGLLLVTGLKLMSEAVVG